MITSLFVVSSCNEDEDRLTIADTQTITEESVSDAYFEDADDMSSVVVYETQNPSAGRASENGRISSDDERVQCATISFAPNSTKTSGQIFIEFPEAGCTVRGNKREGTIILTYSGGPRGQIGFTVVTTFENYKINGVELKGTRTITRVVASAEHNIKHEISLVGGEAIWPDNGGKVTRSSEFSREWIRESANERVTLDGSASGTNRRGKEYTMEITEPLVYRRACMLDNNIHMAVQGIKTFTTEGKAITVDYGDGECDKSITITVNGVTRNVSVN